MSRTFYWIFAPTCLAEVGQHWPSPAQHIHTELVQELKFIVSAEGTDRARWRRGAAAASPDESRWPHGHQHSKLKQHWLCGGWISPPPPPPPQQHQKLSSLHPALAHPCASQSSATQAQMFSTGLAFNNIIIKQLGLTGRSPSPISCSKQGQPQDQTSTEQDGDLQRPGGSTKQESNAQPEFWHSTHVLFWGTSSILHHDARELLQKHSFC